MSESSLDIWEVAFISMLCLPETESMIQAGMRKPGNILMNVINHGRALAGVIQQLEC